MKYVNQLEYTHWLYKTHVEDEGGRPSTVRSSGCGLCSAVMVADRLLPNCQFDIADAIDLSYAVEANHLIGTDYDRFAPAFAEKLGLKFAMTSDPLALRECLRTGGAAVAYVTGKNPERVGLFTRRTHYIAIIGEDGISVVVKSEGLTSAQTLQIQDIVTSETSIALANIKIIPVK